MNAPAHWLKYSATLTDSKLPRIGATREYVERTYREALETALGGVDQVATAYSAFATAIAAIEVPTQAEIDAIDRWEAADRAGCRAAFAGWNGEHLGHFEIASWGFRPPEHPPER